MKAVIDVAQENPTTRQLILGQLMEGLEHLSLNDLQRVLFFAHSLKQPPVGISGRNLLALADLFPQDDIDDLARIIQQARDDETQAIDHLQPGHALP